MIPAQEKTNQWSRVKPENKSKTSFQISEEKGMFNTINGIDIWLKKIKSGSLPYTFHLNSKWAIYISVKNKTIKVKENIGEYF